MPVHSIGQTPIVSNASALISRSTGRSQTASTPTEPVSSIRGSKDKRAANGAAKHPDACVHRQTVTSSAIGQLVAPTGRLHELVNNGSWGCPSATAARTLVRCRALGPRLRGCGSAHGPRDGPEPPSNTTGHAGDRKDKQGHTGARQAGICPGHGDRDLREPEDPTG